MIEDHTLIVTKDHVTSSAQLNPDALGELSEVIAKFQADAKSKGKSHLCFEHGVPFESTVHGGCGICHCHNINLLFEDNQEVNVEWLGRGLI